MANARHIAVLGAGLAGLSAAYRLQQQGRDVTVFEASDEVGGVVQSARNDGFLIERGPNAIQPSVPALEALVTELGLDAERVPANAAAQKRFVVRGGHPVALPMSPPGLLRTPLLSMRGKLRLLREPFVAPSAIDESVADFVRRRLGEEVLDYAVAPFVSGVYAGDPEHLSLRLAFPRLHRLEAEHGSLLRGLLRAKKQKRGERPSLYTFRDGLGRLPLRLAEHLGDAVRTGTPVTSLRRADRGWRVTTARGADRFDAVVSTLPLHRLAALDTDLNTGLFAEARHAPVAVLHLGYDTRHIAHPLDGFGMLIPSVEHRDLLGALFNSTLFPQRAPAGYTLLTAFIGGTRRPDLVDLDDDALYRLARPDLAALLGVDGEPVFRHVQRWRRAIPQYTMDYDRIREHIATLEAARPDLAFAGSYRNGVSVGDTVRSGLAAADRLLTTMSD